MPANEIPRLPAAAQSFLSALLPPRHPLAAKTHLTIEDLASEKLVIDTNAEWPTFRRVVVNVFQSHGYVMNVGQEASSLTGLLGLVTAGVGITLFTAMPRFCGMNAIAARPVVTNPAVLIETHLAWRRTSINMAKRRFIEASQKIGAAYMAPWPQTLPRASRKR